MRLDDQVAIVTGGARGVGLGIAQRLAQDGARVVLWDVDPESFNAEAAGFSPAGLDQVDVADEDSVAAGMRRVLDGLGRLDILVNNAGINGRVADVEDYAFQE